MLMQILKEKDQVIEQKDEEVRQLKDTLSNQERQQTQRIQQYENKNGEINCQLQLMNDEVSARDSVLESNQKQLIVQQQKYDQLYHSYEQVEIRLRQIESEMDEKNQEIQYLKLQDQNNKENLLENEMISQLNFQLNQANIHLKQKEQEVIGLQNNLSQQQEEKQMRIEQFQSSSQEFQNQIGILKQEITVLKNQQKINGMKKNISKMEPTQIESELENAQEIIQEQKAILQQKENTIQELIYKTGQLKEKQAALEQEINELKTSYKKSMKTLNEENESIKTTIDPLQKENSEMFELLNLANMEIEQLKNQLDECEGQEHKAKQEKNTIRDQLDKISLENVRVSHELQSQKDYLGQQQQQIKDLTFIIQSLKTDNFMMSQQIKSGMSLMQSNDKLFLNLPEGDKNASLRQGGSNTQRSNAPLAEKQNKQQQQQQINNNNSINAQTKKSHHETFGQQSLKDINLEIQNSEDQDVQFLMDAEKMNEFLEQNQAQAHSQEEKDQEVQKEEHLQDQQEIQQQKDVIQEQKTGLARDDNNQEEKSIEQAELKKNDSDLNLISIQNRGDVIIQKLINNEINSDKKSFRKSPSQHSKQASQDLQQRVILNNFTNEDNQQGYRSNKKVNSSVSPGQYDSFKSSNKKYYITQSQDVSPYASRIEEQGTPKAPDVRPSFVREIQSPRRRSVKANQQFNNPKNLAYMSFNQQEYQMNMANSSDQMNQFNIGNYHSDIIPEQISTIQSGQNTIYYSNNNTIEQAENVIPNIPPGNEFQHTNKHLKATPIKENFLRQQRLDKLQSLSDYLKSQSKKKGGFSPMNTGPQAIKIPFNYTADFELTMNNESKLNQDYSTLENPNPTEKIRLEDYQNEMAEEESQTDNNDQIPSPQNIELIQYYTEDDLSQQITPLKENQQYNLRNDHQDLSDLDENQLIIKRTQMEDFSSKVSNYDDTQQNDLNQQSQLYYQQIIYPQQPDQYYLNKSQETNKLSSGQVILYEEDFFNHLKILSTENLVRFKKSCLSDKALLFENDHIKIGITHHDHVFSGKNFAKLQMYIFNKDIINDIPAFDLKYLINEDVSVWTKPEKLNGEIKIHKHLKQDLIIDLNCIPFEFLTAHFKVETEGDGGKRVLNEYFLMLPTSINRFLNFSLINANNFKSKWLVNQINGMKTQEFEYNTKMIKSPFVFLKYFVNSIELNPHRKEEFLAGLSDYKFGSIFSFYHLENQQFLLKIIVKPFNKLVFHISPSNGQLFNEDSAKCCHYLLQTLYFLFKYNPLEGMNTDQNNE